MAYCTNNTQLLISCVGNWPNLMRAVGCDKRICTDMAIFKILGVRRYDFMTTKFSHRAIKFVQQVLDKLYPHNPFIAIVMVYDVCGRNAPMNMMERQFYHGLLDSEEF
jgi:hypothetical protein